MKNKPTYQFDGDSGSAEKAFPEIELPYAKSKADVWAELSAATATTTNLRVSDKATWLTLITGRAGMVAALFILSLATVLFFNLYTRTVATAPGEHLAHTLPDGSAVKLNAGSVIHYKPYWWYIRREVLFEGEGYFRVQKGERFTVISDEGITSVLGTSFNVYARKDGYTVTCLSGKVKVQNTANDQAAVIMPNQQARVMSDGQVISRDIANAENSVLWEQKHFVFTATSLIQVFEEIERQYGVQIQTRETMNYSYTGSFKTTQSLEEVMENICLALGLDYHKTDTGYMVIKK